jgi:hypothetical protein
MIGLVVLVTVIAIWLVPGEKKSSHDVAKPADKAAEPSLIAPTESPKETAAEAPPTTAEAPPATAPATPGQAARTLISELRQQPQPDLDRAYAAAQQYEQSGDDDDAYLLYFYAAREGHGPSAMIMAQRSDPATFRDDGLESNADALQANKWYLRAAQAGVDGAETALSALRKRVEDAAAQGDPRAQRIMLQWK